MRMVEAMDAGPILHVVEEPILPDETASELSTRLSELGAQALVELDLGGAGRLLVRPSGTEPKLKIYADLAGEVGDSPIEDRDRLTARARELAEELAALAGL
jgi:phosphomannomutase